MLIGDGDRGEGKGARERRLDRAHLPGRPRRTRGTPPERWIFFFFFFFFF